MRVRFEWCEANNKNRSLVDTSCSSHLCVVFLLVFGGGGGTRVHVMFMIFCTRQRDLLAGNVCSINTKITSPRKNMIMRKHCHS